MNDTYKLLPTFEEVESDWWNVNDAYLESDINEECGKLEWGSEEYDECAQEVEDAFLEQGKERFKDVLLDARHLIDECPLKIYRGSSILKEEREGYLHHLQKREFDQLQKLGTHWSLAKSTAYDFAREGSDDYAGIIYYGLANAKDIDWKTTISKNMALTYGKGGWSDEQEVHLKPNIPLYVEKIKVMNGIDTDIFIKEELIT